MSLPGGVLSPWGRARLRRYRNPDMSERRVRRRVSSVAMVVPRPPPRGARTHPRFPAYFGDQPLRKYAKLKYVVHENTIGPAAAALKQYQYRANSPYDPEYAVGGHQPYGWDQLMLKYFHATVLKSTCKVELMGVGNNVDLVMQLHVYQEAGAPAAAFAAGGANGLQEMPITSQTLMLTNGIYQGQGRSQMVRADMSKIFGKTYANLVGDSRFQCSDAADPTEDVYFGVTFYHPAGEDISANPVRFKVTITYYTVFTEPRWFTTS